MFTFSNFNKKYPYNSTLSKYCIDSTNNSIRKLTYEFNEERKKNQGVLVKKFFNDKFINNNNNNNENNENNNKEIIIKTISFLSALHFTLNFLFYYK
jgi:hypothetical protein